MPWSAERYTELEEQPAVLTPLHPTHLLLPEHFSTPLPQLRYPVKLDFAHERFRLRSLQLLSQLKDTALQEIDLSDNELQSLSELSRFSALKTLCARRNRLTSGPGVHLTVHRLTRLDVSDNRLREMLPLKELTLLQVLNVSRNQISDGWDELSHCAGLQACDASQNEFRWDPDSGELQRAMAVLRGLKRLRVLNLGQNPVAAQKYYRAWVLTNARKLEVFDNSGVSEAEREGEEVTRAAELLNRRGAEAPKPPPLSQRDAPRPSQQGDGDEPAGPRMSRVFGVLLQEMLGHEGSGLPLLVLECTRHVQERVPRESSALTADADPSLVLQLRNAFERGPDAGGRLLVELADHRGRQPDADVRTACNVLRSFLHELPVPVVPAQYFLPLLKETQASGASVVQPLGARLEVILAPMEDEHWALLEHMLCFLVNASRQFGLEGDVRQRVARVWAPCILRAPARMMSQFKGNVINAMATALLSLLDQRTGDGAPLIDLADDNGGQVEAQHQHQHQHQQQEEKEEPEEGDDDDDDGSANVPPSPSTKKRNALLDSLAEWQTEKATRESMDSELLTNLMADQPTRDTTTEDDAKLASAEEQLRQQRQTADELLAALADMQADDCSLLDEDASVVSSHPPVAFAAQGGTTPRPNLSDPPLPAAPPPPACQLPLPLEPHGASPAPAAQHQPAPAPAPMPMLPPPTPALMPPMMHPPPQLLPPGMQAPPPHAMQYHQPPPHPYHQPQYYPQHHHPPGSCHPYVDDDTCSRISGASSHRSTSSHRMAAAAAAALESREAEAAKLKLKAQRLLRERSELAVDLEGLQETLGRMERAVNRAREQAQALRSEKSLSTSSDTRRHSTQLSTLSKAVLREKQRRLAARNEVGSLQRQLSKKRTQHEQIASRCAALTQEHTEARKRRERAETAVEKSKHIKGRLRQCQQAIAKQQEATERAAAGGGPPSPSVREQQRDLEARLSGLRQAIAQQRASIEPPPSSPKPPPARSPPKSTAASQRRALLEALAVEQARTDECMAALRASTGVWSQLAHQLQAELPAVPSSDHTCHEALAEAAKWHAEARAFAAEARKVERLHQQAARKREAEREGWRDFQKQVAVKRNGGGGGAQRPAEEDAEAARHELGEARAALQRAQAESEDLLRTEASVRRALDDARSRLQSRRALAAELGAGLQ